MKKYKVYFSKGNAIKNNAEAELFCYEYGLTLVDIIKDDELDTSVLTVESDDADIIGLLSDDDRVYKLEDESGEDVSTIIEESLLPSPEDFIKKHVELAKVLSSKTLINEGNGEDFGDEIRLINGWLIKTQPDLDDFVSLHYTK